jgi:hypothetical protein
MQEGDLPDFSESERTAAYRARYACTLAMERAGVRWVGGWEGVLLPSQIEQSRTAVVWSSAAGCRWGQFKGHQKPRLSRLE